MIFYISKHQARLLCRWINLPRLSSEVVDCVPTKGHRAISAVKVSKICRASSRELRMRETGAERCASWSNKLKRPVTKLSAWNLSRIPLLTVSAEVRVRRRGVKRVCRWRAL